METPISDLSIMQLRLLYGSRGLTNQGQKSVDSLGLKVGSQGLDVVGGHD